MPAPHPTFLHMTDRHVRAMLTNWPARRSRSFPDPGDRRCVLGDDHHPALPKGHPLLTALGRLGDVAGTQLDERLVVAFIEGIETAQDAPMPGEQPQGPGLWIPRTQVA